MSGLPPGFQIQSGPPPKPPAGFVVQSGPPPTSAPTPSAKPGKSPLQQVEDAATGAYKWLDAGHRNFAAERTKAARDPVGALANVGGALEGAVAGGIMAPMMSNQTTIPGSLMESGRGVIRGLSNPVQRDKYNEAFTTMMIGAPPTNPTMPQTIGRAAANFGLQTAMDPVTHGGGAIARGIAGIAKPAAAAAVRRVGPVRDYVNDVRDTFSDIAKDPRVGPVLGKVTHGISTLLSPVRGGVDAGKDLLFMNFAPHGLGNMTLLNYLRNGPGTAMKGIYYGLRGAPRATQYELERMGAGAWTPELMGQPSPWGPVGWMNALGKRGVPAAVRAAGGSAAGGAIADKTAPSTDTTQQRLTRDLEGAILGGLMGASPEVLNTSNRIMSRLETGHRAAMLESLPKPTAATKVKPKYSAAEVAAYLARRKVPEVMGPAVSTTANRAARGSGLGSPNLFQHGMKVDPPVDPRAALINAAFGGGKKGPAAKIATALGGPFVQYQGEIVPRAVTWALLNHPERVEALARGQDVVNRDVLGNKPYKMQMGGPVGDYAEMLADPVRYGTRLLGPLANQDPSAARNPKSLSLSDKLKDAAYEGIPGRSVVGPAFGDTMYPTRAPAVPSAALNNLLGWHFSNKTPRQDAILSIMRSSGLDATEAGYLYDRMKPR